MTKLCLLSMYINVKIWEHTMLAIQLSWRKMFQRSEETTVIASSVRLPRGHGDVWEVSCAIIIKRISTLRRHHRMFRKEQESFNTNFRMLQAVMWNIFTWCIASPQYFLFNNFQHPTYCVGLNNSTQQRLYVKVTDDFHQAILVFRLI